MMSKIVVRVNDRDSIPAPARHVDRIRCDDGNDDDSTDVWSAVGKQKPEKELRWLQSQQWLQGGRPLK